jgi:hypothetical protein
MKNQTQGTLIVALAALVAVLLGVGAYFLLYSPLLEDKAAAEEKAMTIEAANAKAAAELATLAEKQKELPELQERLAAVRAKFPGSLELAQFTTYLADLVDLSEARVVSVTPHAPVQLMSAQPLPECPTDAQARVDCEGYPAPTVGQPPPGLYQHQFTIRVRGTWPQAYKYLNLLQSEGARLFLVTKVDASAQSVGGADAETGVFEFSIEGYTYALAVGETAPTQTEGQTEGEADGQTSDQSTDPADEGGNDE